ncbi:MAG: ABC-type microcin C transport system duplicated ATPase subunit YejF, partial [Alphaproteobacteria bacterium]
MAKEMTETSHLLDVRDLAVRFRGTGRDTDAVKGVSFTIDRGET